MKILKYVKISVIAISMVGFAWHFTAPLRAQTVEELQAQISNHSSTIKQLEEEINKYQVELQKTSAQAKTLQNTVKSLDLNAKKLSTDLKVTEGKINTTDLTIQQLSKEILIKERDIETNKIALANAIRRIHESDSKSLLATMLVYPNLSTFWNEVDTLNQFQSKVQEQVSELKSLQNQLLANKSLTQTKKNELLGLKTQLADQKTVVEVNKNEKSKLLAVTKETETGYKQLIAQKEAKKKAFEAELLQVESQLKLKIDPNSLPSAKSGVLGWPLSKHIITQYFGNTAFAQSGAYNGSGHNGIDLGTPIGTAVLSAESGTVVGTGDTDTVCPNASYGKWVLVQHNNGLSTLYAHLSVIKASQGQQVALGEVIGYSGNTGYSTGPHLHFTVYATQGVKIMSRKSAACGGTYTMPIADLKAYLNPLSYL
jgi:murein DD-endopeptidase MepM/ murein hydrolase activator NlpD